MGVVRRVPRIDARAARADTLDGDAVDAGGEPDDEAVEAGVEEYSQG